VVAIFTLVEHGEVFEEVHVVEHYVGIVRKHFVPVLAAGVGDGGVDEAEVASVSLVRM